MRYHNITKDDMLNGPGLRVVLWVAGCEHHCKGCHNPETWDKDGGIPFDEDAEKEIFEELDKDHIKGITITGGDPLAPYNIKDVIYLCCKIKIKYGDKKDIWIYTGYTLDSMFGERERLLTTYVRVPDSEDKLTADSLSVVDYIVDGEFVESLKDNKLHYRGSSNQKIYHITIDGEFDVTESFDKGIEEENDSEYTSHTKVPSCEC